MKKLLLLLFFLVLSVSYAQDYFPTNAGVKIIDNTLVAFTNATIYVTPNKIIKKGTLLIENGKIIQVGKLVKIPKGAKIVVLSGKTIYPSFIDSNFGIEKVKKILNASSGNVNTDDSFKLINSFHKNVQKAIKYSADKEKTLIYLTTVPTTIIGNNTIGNLNIGNYANFIITSEDIFDFKITIHENWVQGNKNVTKDITIKDITGNYMLSVNHKNYDLTITGKGAKQTATLKRGGKKLNSKFSYKDDLIAITFNIDTIYTRLIGKIINVANVMQGTAFDSEGNETYWSASKVVRAANRKK